MKNMLNYKIANGLREIVFGAEDGMVSTLGALTGIAIGTADQHTIILAGLVIVAVESTSMSIGSFLSTKSIKEFDRRKITEEKEQIKNLPLDEKQELVALFIKDGWPASLSKTMAETATKSRSLMLKEMSYRELNTTPGKKDAPLFNAALMFISYATGGVIPVLPYLIFPVAQSIYLSIVITLAGLFLLGVLTTKFTKRNWFKAGLEMLVLASIAATIGYIIGSLADKIKV